MSEQQACMRKVQEYGFALNEANLYLDTHPTCQKALCYYKEMRDAYQNAVADYASKYGPLTVNDVQNGDVFTWVTTPWPWETEGC